MSDVDRAALEAARAAADELKRLQQLERRASELPELEAMAQAADRKRQADQTLAQARQNGRQRLEAAQEDVQAWRRQYEAARAKILALVAELPGLQQEIGNVARGLYEAAGEAVQAEAATAPADAWGTRPIRSQQTVNGRFAGEWQHVTHGLDLDCLPEDDPISLAVKQKLAKARVYNSRYGARAFFK